MDLGAVKAAAAPTLVRCAIAAATNAHDLLDDAESLSAIGRHARAYALAALAVEESGKALSLSALAMMPVSLRARAPLGRMLEWHQLKLVGGILIAAVPFGERTVAAQFAAMSTSQVTGIMDNAQALAEDQDLLKQRGLYADIDRSGRVRLPSEVTETDVAAHLDRARRAVSSASTVLEPGWPAYLSNPPAEAVELCRALVSAFAEARPGRTPHAAAAVFHDAVTKLQKQTAASGARARTGCAERGK